MSNHVYIEEFHGGFAIHVNGERFSFDQDESVENLKVVFAMLVGADNVEYEEVY